MKKPGSVTVVVGVLILMLAGGSLLAREENGHPLIRGKRMAPMYARTGDYAEYEGGLICRVMRTKDPYREMCPPGTPEDRVLVAMRFEEHVRGTEFETKFLDQFHKAQEKEGSK